MMACQDGRRQTSQQLHNFEQIIAAGRVLARKKLAGFLMGEHRLTSAAFLNLAGRTADNGGNAVPDRASDYPLPKISVLTAFFCCVFPALQYFACWKVERLTD
jgi:hypothetical protein